MKTLLSGALIAAVAMTGAAMAFGPGYQTNQQMTQNNGQFQMQRPGMRQGMGPGMRQGMGRRMDFNQTQTNAFPNRGKRTGEPVFVDSWDSDEDGTVSLAEANERRAEFFSVLDDDEDGKIVAKEFTAFLTNQRMPPEEATNGQRGLFGMDLAFNDANKDGFVTKEEFLAQTQRWLDGMDRSGDGKVTSADFGPRNGQMANNSQSNQTWGPGRGMKQGMQRGMGRGMRQGMGRGMGMRWQQQAQ